LRGYNKPLAIDNEALYAIFSEASQRIWLLERTLKEIKDTLASVE
jgi:hypothetical protein